MKLRTLIFIIISIAAIPPVVLSDAHAYLPLHILVTLLVISIGIMSARKLNFFSPLTFTSIYIIVVFISDFSFITQEPLLTKNFCL